MPVEVWKVPPFDLTLVPLLWNDDPDHAILSEVESLAPEDDVFWQTRDLLPVGEFQLSIREPILTSVDPIHENRGRLLSEVRAIHLMDGGQGHYMGVLRGYGGVAVIGNPTILSGLNASTIAHELGHALSLGHTNCGDTAVIGIDPGYPYENGDIGVWGYDMRDGTLVPPDTKDMMGYCRPVWISDYHFVKAMRFSWFCAAIPGVNGRFSPDDEPVAMGKRGRVGTNEPGTCISGLRAGRPARDGWTVPSDWRRQGRTGGVQRELPYAPHRARGWRVLRIHPADEE